MAGVCVEAVNSGRPPSVRLMFALRRLGAPLLPRLPLLACTQTQAYGGLARSSPPPHTVVDHGDFTLLDAAPPAPLAFDSKFNGWALASSEHSDVLKNDIFPHSEGEWRARGVWTGGRWP